MEAFSAGRLRVVDAGLACCALEYSAAAIAEQEWDKVFAVPSDHGPADVLIVTGTVTKALLPVVQAARAELGPQAVVISYGACTTSGGPYWDSYSVVPGIAADIHVPGCPPPPSAVFAALVQARELVASRAR